MTVSLRFLGVFWLEMCVAYKGIILWFWRESMYGWKTCCYAEAVVCRESAALLRFAVYISELVLCIMSALDLLTLKLYTEVPLFLLCRSSCSRLLLLPPDADHFLFRWLKSVAVCQCCYLNVSLAVGTAALLESSSSFIHSKHNVRLSDVSK
jgi:hypothetical protein